MKHLKTFEAHEKYRQKYDYEIGDYVELWVTLLNQPDKYRKGEVVNIVTHNAYVAVFVKEYISGIPIKMELSPINIKRKLTPEEAEEYKISIEVEKYNI